MVEININNFMMEIFTLKNWFYHSHHEIILSQQRSQPANISQTFFGTKILVQISIDD